MASIKHSFNKNIREYIIDINNKLFELKQELNLDIPEITKISETFNDDVKREIIDIVIKTELEERELKEKFVRDAMIAAQIEEKEDVVDYSQYSLYNRENKNRSIDSGGLLPPKTDWERVDLPKDEKNKILESIRANPKSNVFSKEFNWNPKDFLGAFGYLEQTNNYNGPFIISIVDDKGELEKYSKIQKLSDGIQKICVGKYLLLSIYDITASSNESKHIYMGLKYVGITGRLELDSIGSTTGDVKNSQKKIAMEYMDAMGIIYDENHVDLKIS